MLAWKGFIAVVVDSYRSITVPLFDFVFGWLPFSVPMWINDYIVFGSIYGGSAIRAYSSAREE